MADEAEEPGAEAEEEETEVTLDSILENVVRMPQAQRNRIRNNGGIADPQDLAYMDIDTLLGIFTDTNRPSAMVLMRLRALKQWVDSQVDVYGDDGWQIGDFTDEECRKIQRDIARSRTKSNEQRQQTPPSPPSSVKIPSTVVDLLEKNKGKPLTTAEIDYALNEFRHYVDEIVNASTEHKKKMLASTLWIRLSVRIRTRTRLLLKEQYLFDGPVPGATTGLGTEIQFALKGSSLFCAKIMQNVEALKREYDTAVKIHAGQLCPTVMPTIDFIRIPGETARAAMITPYYPLALTVTDNGLLRLEGSINAALCGVATLKAFSVKNLCHGDIKPANMMFCASAKTVVMIDFGSASVYGESLTSTTPQFGLNHPPTASLEYDLTCLATSLYVLSTGKSPPDTIQQLKAILAFELQNEMHPTLQIAQRCLVFQGGIDGIWEDARGCVEKYLHHLDKELLVRYDDIWPVAG